MRTFTRVPAGVGTTIFSPSANSAYVTGTSIATLAPSRANHLCGFMCKVTVRSPAGCFEFAPPALPALPAVWPASELPAPAARDPPAPAFEPALPAPTPRPRYLNFEPSVAPAGIFTFTVSVFFVSGRRIFTRFSAPLNASSNVISRFTFMFLFFCLALVLLTVCCVVLPPPKSLKLQFVPKAPSPLRKLSKISCQLPKPLKKSDTLAPPPAPPHAPPRGILLSCAVPYWSYNLRFFSSLSTSYASFICLNFASSPPASG